MKNKLIDLVGFLAIEKNKWKLMSRVRSRFSSCFPAAVLRVKSKHEKKHLDVWDGISRKTHPMFYRAYSHYSGNLSTNFVPDDLFHLYCLPVLNIKEFDKGYSDHYFISRILPDEIQSEVLFRNIEEVYYDKNNQVTQINDKRLKEIMEYREEIILKPSLEADQYKKIQLFRKVNGVFLNQNNEKLSIQYLNQHYQKNFVAELPIRLHPSILKFAEYGFTALRFYMYRSPLTEKVVMLGCCLVSEKQGYNEADMVRAGNVFMVNEEGKIQVFTKPGIEVNFNINFKSMNDAQIPGMNDLIKYAKTISEVNYYHRVIAVDLTLDENRKTKMRGIRNRFFDPIALQFTGRPFFGNYTEEVLEYCSSRE